MIYLLPASHHNAKSDIKAERRERCKCFYLHRHKMLSKQNKMDLMLGVPTGKSERT
jgi:hypothetical protein